MSSVTAIEAQERFAELLRQVERGEQVIITRRKKPVARLIRESPQEAWSSEETLLKLKALRTRIEARSGRKEKVTLAEFKSAVAEGRR